MSKNFKIKEGSEISENPIIEIVGNGPNTYLWVGNNAEGNKKCLGTLSGIKTLEGFACGILNALGYNATSVKKTIYKKLQNSKGR